MTALCLILIPLLSLFSQDQAKIAEVNEHFKLSMQKMNGLREAKDYAAIVTILNEELDYYESFPKELKQYFSLVKSSVYYDMACYLSLQDKKEAAILALELASVHGYSDYAHMEEDTDLDNIRQDVAFTRIYNSLRERYDYIGILKASPAYLQDPQSDTIERFVYQSPADSALNVVRSYFNLDSIAGNGDDISRIKNLMYWVHDNIRHDGGNGLASGGRNLINTYEAAKRNNCGYNCRALAICLTEALLAEGIPARYLTCQSKAWNTDPDCHVICVAWSESLDKWIWVDPSFAAFVTDENGLLLHPGEVRYRLQHDMPLVLNEDANWNHESMQTKEYYLEYYMAKNLYIIEANTINQSEPEGPTSHPKGKFVALVPQNSDYSTQILTSDDVWFWQSPIKN